VALVADDVVVLVQENELVWLEVVDEVLDKLVDLLLEVKVLDLLELDGDIVKTVSVVVTVLTALQLGAGAGSDGENGFGKHVYLLIRGRTIWKTK